MNDFSRKKEKGKVRERKPEQVKTKELEAEPPSKAKEASIDASNTEGPLFQPRFDPYFDGDHGKIEEALEYFAAKALSSSSVQSSSAEVVEKSTTKKDDVKLQTEVEAEQENQSPKMEGLSDVDLLRVRLWRARASHSRQAGLALVILSAALFAGAFYTAALILEIGSVSSFVIGVGLLAYDAEPRVKLFPSMSALIGPLKVVEKELEQHGVSTAEAVFEKAPASEGSHEVMTFVGGGADAPRYSIPPMGEGLVKAYEMELGDLTQLGLDGAKVWLPRVMVEGLGLADRVKMNYSGNEVTTVMEKPFVRVLCVQDFMTDGLCKASGCPLAASVGQTLARASGKSVTHHGCSYDPVTQKATLKDTIEP